MADCTCDAEWRRLEQRCGGARSSKVPLIHDMDCPLYTGTKYDRTGPLRAGPVTVELDEGVA